MFHLRIVRVRQIGIEMRRLSWLCEARRISRSKRLSFVVPLIAVEAG